MTPSTIPDHKCPHCHGGRIFRGRFAGTPGAACPSESSSCVTLCKQDSKGWLTWGYPACSLDDDAFVCLDCGFLWTTVNVAAVLQMIQRYGTKEVRGALGLRPE